MISTTPTRPTHNGLRRHVVLACSLALVIAGCGSDGDGGDDATATPLPSATTSTPEPSDEPSTPTPSEDPTSDEPTDDESTTDDALPGEAWEGFARSGDVMMVIGVAHDDVLNVRARPGTDADIVVEAAPTADDLVATGRGRQLPSSFWYEVEVDGTTGWASAAFLAFMASVDDDTSAYVAEHGRPSAETMQELGEIVAADYASEDPPSTIVQSVAPSVGDLGEVVMDVVGIGDDSVRGFRVHVFATPDESGEGFTLRTIELWTFCDRGVAASTGVCV